MVRIDRIYTRTGDNGTTMLGSGRRVSKTHFRIRAGGTVDEANCAIGAAASVTDCDSTVSLLRKIQHHLFDLGADLTCPPDPDGSGRPPSISQEHSQWLEAEIDNVTEGLQPLTSFILPGGSHAASALHLARAICRRAEIDVMTLHESEPVNTPILMYLNRLSDLLFSLARKFNNNGADDILWNPNQSVTHLPGQSH